VGSTTATHEPVIARSNNGVNWTIIPQTVFTARINAVGTKRVLPYEGITHSVMRFGTVNPYVAPGVPNTEMTNIGMMFPGDLYMDISGRNLYKYYFEFQNTPLMGGIGGDADLTPIMNFGPIIQYGTAGTPSSDGESSIIGVSTICFTPNTFTSPPNVTATIVGGSVVPGVICITDVTSTCFSTFTYELPAGTLTDYRFNWQAMI
jgi:hypothetical protein